MNSDELQAEGDRSSGEANKHESVMNCRQKNKRLKIENKLVTSNKEENRIAFKKETVVKSTDY